LAVLPATWPESIRRMVENVHALTARSGIWQETTELVGKLNRHGKLGAAAGCAVGHHEANKKDPNNANAQQQPPSGQK